jgi:hypothetical protein
MLPEAEIDAEPLEAFSSEFLEAAFGGKPAVAEPENSFIRFFEVAYKRKRFFEAAQRADKHERFIERGRPGTSDWALAAEPAD